MKVKINNELMYGEYTNEQIEQIHAEMRKPQNKRLYLFGVEFSQVNNVEVLR